MKTILLATDFSDAASNAAEYTAQLARDTGAELLLFNVFKLSIHASNSLASTTNIEHLTQNNEDQLVAMVGDLKARFHINVRWEMGMDDTIESLKAYTLHHSVDLVVMGIESNLTEYKLFGNTTTAAIKLMQFPLLVVPNGVTYTGLGRIMYACEPSLLEPGCQLPLLRHLAAAFQAQIEVFHVMREDSEKDRMALEAKMDQVLKDVDHVYRYVWFPRVGEGIRVGLEESPADLVVMIHHKPTFFESLLKGSNSSQMSVRTQVPLLVLPSPMAC